MKHTFSLLLAAGAAYALPVEVTKRDVDAGLLSQLSFFEQYSAAAYCQSNNDNAAGTAIACNGNCNDVQSAGAISIAEFQDQGTADATGFVSVDDKNKQIVVAYRGSHSVLNWLGNIDFVTVPFLCSGCEVHQGFLSSWTATQQPVTAAIKSALAIHPDYSVIATGHSLGAAIATLAAANLRSQGMSVALYTYGSPMVGNDAFATSVSQSGPTYRVTHAKDAVPMVPGYEIEGYRHTYPEYWITTPDNVFPTTSDITVVNSGTLDLDGNESPSNLPGSISNHLWYFNSVAGCAPAGFEIAK